MSTEVTEEKMTSHIRGLEEAEACGGPPAKPHFPKEELKWLGNVSIGEEAPKLWCLLTLGMKDEEVEEKALGIMCTQGSHAVGRQE